MIEIVVPDSNEDELADERLSIHRQLVGRTVYAFDGPREDALSLAAELSENTGGAPVLVNDVASQTDDSRTVDIYMHRDGQRMSVSKGVERPLPE